VRVIEAVCGEILICTISPTVGKYLIFSAGDPSYRIWGKLRDLSGDLKRETEIINIQKYDVGMSYNAIPTFWISRLPYLLPT